jgi:hypothetical protein
LEGSINHLLRKAILCKLKERADQVYSEFRSGDPASNAILLAGKLERGDDELTMFGGQTRVITSKLLSSRSQKGTHSQSASPSPSAQSGSEGDAAHVSAEQTPDVHPALMEYLSMFPVGNNSSNTSHPPDFDYHHDFAALPSFQELGYTAQDNQMQVSWEPPSSSMTTSPSAPDYSSPQSSSDTASFMPFAPQSDFGTTQSNNDFNGGNLFDFDLGMMISSDTGMDEQWTSFMRDTGLLDRSLIGSGSYGVGETMQSVKEPSFL